MKQTFEIDSISQAHASLGLAKPKHPLVTVVYAKDFKSVSNFQNVKIINNLYQIIFKSSKDCGRL